MHYPRTKLQFTVSSFSAKVWRKLGY